MEQMYSDGDFDLEVFIDSVGLANGRRSRSRHHRQSGIGLAASR